MTTANSAHPDPRPTPPEPTFELRKGTRITLGLLLACIPVGVSVLGLSLGAYVSLRSDVAGLQTSGAVEAETLAKLTLSIEKLADRVGEERVEMIRIQAAQDGRLALAENELASLRERLGAIEARLRGMASNPERAELMREVAALQVRLQAVEAWVASQRKGEAR